MSLAWRRMQTDERESFSLIRVDQYVTSVLAEAHCKVEAKKLWQNVGSHWV